MASILVVDDEVDSSMLLKRVLERDGHNVVTCGDGDKAVAWVASNPLDLAIINAKPYRKGGNELAGRLKALNPNIVVMTITNYVSDDSARLTMGDDFLTKPIDLDVIEAKVRELLESTPVS